MAPHRLGQASDILPEGGDVIAHFGGDAVTQVTFAFHPRDPLEVLPLLRLGQGTEVGHQLIAPYLDPAMTAVHFLQPLQRDSAIARLLRRLEVILNGLVQLLLVLLYRQHIVRSLRPNLLGNLPAGSPAHQWSQYSRVAPK